MKPALLTLIALGILTTTRLLAQSTPISVGLSQNGTLICTNLQPGTIATVEWAPSASGPWTNNWAGLEAVVADTNGAIQVSVPMFYRVLGTPQGTVTIDSPTNLTVYEGSSANLQVRLAFKPRGDVVVSVKSPDATKITISPASLTFTPSNWDTYQNLIVTGASDADAMDEATSIQLAAPDLADRVVAVTVLDDDQALVLSSSQLIVTEGSSLTLGIALAGKPAANINANVSSSNPAAATVSPNAIVFTPDNWDTFQMVTVTGVQDANTANANLIVTVSAGTLTPTTVPVVVNDDDVLAIGVSAAEITVVEGSSGIVQARLTAQPVSNVSVAAATSDSGKATVSPSSLIFTPVNWNLFQNLTVSGVQDLDTTNEVVDLSLSASSLSTRTVTVNVSDND